MTSYCYAAAIVPRTSQGDLFTIEKNPRACIFEADMHPKIIFLMSGHPYKMGSNSWLQLRDMCLILQMRACKNPRISTSTCQHNHQKQKLYKNTQFFFTQQHIKCSLMSLFTLQTYSNHDKMSMSSEIIQPLKPPQHNIHARASSLVFGNKSRQNMMGFWKQFNMLIKYKKGVIHKLVNMLSRPPMQKVAVVEVIMHCELCTH